MHEMKYLFYATNVAVHVRNEIFYASKNVLCKKIEFFITNGIVHAKNGILYATDGFVYAKNGIFMQQMDLFMQQMECTSGKICLIQNFLMNLTKCYNIIEQSKRHFHLTIFTNFDAFGN